jgi:hypothetical protein
MGHALGLRSEGGNAFIKMLSGQTIRSDIPEDLAEKIAKPVIFKGFKGDPVHGYEASVLIEVCEALIRVRDKGGLTARQQFLAIQSEFILRSSAKLGIIALIDEATGYSDNKRKDEYRQLFQEFLRDEFAQWEQDEYPEKFFGMIYRLYGLKRKNPDSTKHPQFFGKFIRRYVYYPLANSHGAILEQLDQRNPVVYVNGGRRYKMYQFLSEKVGLPALRAHLWQTIGIAYAPGSSHLGSLPLRHLHRLQVDQRGELGPLLLDRDQQFVERDVLHLVVDRSGETHRRQLGVLVTRNLLRCR